MPHTFCADHVASQVFKIEHDIPICESVSPNSSYRWHSMTEEQYDAYLKRPLAFSEARPLGNEGMNHPHHNHCMIPWTL